MKESPPLEDRFLGCLLGLAVGDATGAPCEGMPALAIWYDLGGARHLIANPPDVLTYTDDTQMCIGVAETLVEHGRIDEATLCRRFVENYQPDRGYGRGARRIIEAMASGDDWRTLASTLFPGGSLGNGAAMRVAPVGLLFRADLDRVSDEATRSAIPTHVHPVGIDGARVLAISVALAVRDGPFERAAFFKTLLSFAATREFVDAIETAAALRPGDNLGPLGSSLEAHRSVVTAVACFAASPDDYVTAIATAISLGDDTDTVAAMAGALVGARSGIRAVPGHLLARLEDGTKGRSYLHELARRLSECASA